MNIQDTDEVMIPAEQLPLQRRVYTEKLKGLEPSDSQRENILLPPLKSQTMGLEQVVASVKAEPDIELSTQVQSMRQSYKIYMSRKEDKSIDQKFKVVREHHFENFRQMSAKQDTPKLNLRKKKKRCSCFPGFY